MAPDAPTTPTSPTRPATQEMPAAPPPGGGGAPAGASDGHLLGGRYHLEALLGHGGMSDVYRATDATGGPPVAVKLVRSTDPELARRLTQEADAAAQLEHPGLVRLLDAGVHDGRPYLVMELVEGPTLAARLARGPLPPDRCAALGGALAEALAYVHGQGIVHRDVKPGNVLLGPGPRVRLADFGIAQLVDASVLTMTGTTLGTAAYMAPEQLKHHRVGPSADVWSLGAILLESLTGRRGFHGPPAEVLARRLAGDAPATDHLPTPWRLLLGAMLADDPDRRPDAGEIAEMLHAPAYSRPWVPPVAGEADGDATRIAVSPATAVAPAPVYGTAPPRRVPMAAFAVGLAALLVILLVLALTGGSPSKPAGASPPHRSSTTTTTTPTAGEASAALVRDVQQAEAAGTLSAAAGQAILTDLGRALGAAAQGDPQGASDALGAIENTVAVAAQNGQASASDASTLLADVATLAAVLNVPAPTTTTPNVAPGPNGQAPPSKKHDH